MSDADIVLEAVVEDVQVKNRLFKGTCTLSSEHDIVITCRVNGIPGIALCIGIRRHCFIVSRRGCAL